MDWYLQDGLEYFRLPCSRTTNTPVCANLQALPPDPFLIWGKAGEGGHNSPLDARFSMKTHFE